MSKSNPHSYATDTPRTDLLCLQEGIEERTVGSSILLLVALARQLERDLNQRGGPMHDQWWRDASRERPHRNRLVIAWSRPYGALLANRSTSNPDFGWSCEGKVTHWMPLPQPPATKDEL